MLTRISRFFRRYLELDSLKGDGELDAGSGAMRQEEALARARAVAGEEGWLRLEGVHGPTQVVLLRDAQSGRKVWSASPGRMFVRGCNFHIVIDDETGEVLRKSYTPR